MNKIYQRIDWENYPSSATPLNEDNLNKMDYAIDKLDDRIVTHETTKLNTATGNTLVKNVTFDEKTGVFTIEKLSGSKITINTALEKISTNFHFNPTTQKLVLTLIDGTVQEIDLSALITQYEFIESDTITFEIDANGKVKANILNGSITGEKLEPNYLADVTLQANNAKTSADKAKTSEELAYQYAEEAKESASQTAKSDAKNITYDNTESGLSATNVKDALDEVAQGSVSAITTDTTITDSTNAPLIYGKFKGYTLQNGEPTPDNPVEINGLAKDGTIEVKTCGKNLMKVEKSGNSWQCNVSVADDGKITLTNTVTAGVAYGRVGLITFKANKTYTISVKDVENLKHYTFFKKGTSESASIAYASGTVTVKPTVDVETELIVYMNDISEMNKTTSLYIQIEEGDTATTYEPYTETFAEFDLTEPLYEGDYIEYRADGTGVLHRKMAKVVFDGSSDELWGVSLSTSTNTYYAYLNRSVSTLGIKKNCTNIYSTHYKATGRIEGVANNIYSKDDGTLIVREERFATVNEYKAWLQSNPVTVVYELAEPTETPLTAEQVEQFKKLYTFEPITNVLCEGETEIQYYKNTPSGVAVGTVHRMANDEKATYDGDGNVITSTYATKEDLENFDNSVELTKAEYDSLSDDKLTNNIIYFIKDM